MLEQVDLKIKELKKLRTEEYYKKKDEDLNAWGLTNKKNGKKTTPIIVTDEEYEALIKAANGVGKTGRNSVANTMKFAEIAVLVVGVLGGIAAWSSSDGAGFVWFSFCVIAGIVVALIFKGIAEAIRLLQQLVDLNPIEKPDPSYAKAPQQRYSQPNVVMQPPVVPVQVPTYIQPPIYQASPVPQPVAQPYYQPAAPAQPAKSEPVAEKAPSFGAPQNYNEINAFENELGSFENETGTFENEVQDDFFMPQNMPSIDFDYERGI